MKWLLIVIGTLVVLVLTVIAIGAVLPKAHVASRSAHYDQPPESVWSTITDHPNMPSWRSELKSVERLPDRDGHAVWREHYKNGDALTLETIEITPPRRLVEKISDPDLPFGGTWTFEVTPENRGTRFRITENGEIYNPLFRFVARFIMGYTSTIDNFLISLGKKFSQNVTVEP